MKKHVIWLIAVVLAATAAAFTMPATTRPLNTQFKYMGPVQTPDYTNPDNWQVSSDPTGCGGSGVKCLVTPQDPGIDTPEELASEIEANNFNNITTDSERDQF